MQHYHRVKITKNNNIETIKKVLPGVSSTSMKCSSPAVLLSSGSSKRPIKASNNLGQCTMYAGSKIAGPICSNNKNFIEQERMKMVIFLYNF